MKAEVLGVLFDEADRHIIEAHSWWLNTGGYACTKVRKDGRYVTVQMHRMILGELPSGSVVDHINRNILDNRRGNLRVCSYSTNACNTKDRAGKASKFRGVAKRGDKWQVVVRVGGRLKWIGTYANEDEAARVAAPYFDNPEHRPMDYGLGVQAE